mgnify:CR=1 FL=1
MSFNKNKQWADKFIPEIKAALAPYLIRVPNLEADIKRCSDLITLNKRISVRTRKYEDLRYKHEFTIRAKTKNKNRSELEKIATGWGDDINDVNSIVTHCPIKCNNLHFGCSCSVK